MTSKQYITPDGTLGRVEGGAEAVANHVASAQRQSLSTNAPCGSGREDPLPLPSTFDAAPGSGKSNTSLRAGVRNPDAAPIYNENVMPVPSLHFEKTHKVVGSGPVRNVPEPVGEAMPLPPSTV